MIKVHVFTNLDLYNEEWPTELPAIPRKGDEFESMTLWSNSKTRLSLTVVGITWKYIERTQTYVPYIELHLNPNRYKTIYDFYEWYASKVGKSVGAFI